MTLDNLAQITFLNLGGSYRTVEIYKNNYEKFWQPSFGNKESDLITIDEIEEHLQDLTLFYSMNTIKAIQQSIMSVFRYAYDNRFIERIPNFKRIKLYNQKHTQKPMIIKTKDYKDLLLFIKHGRSKNAQSYYIALCIMRHTGCRLAESFALLTDDVCLNEHTIIINKQVGVKAWHLGFSIVVTLFPRIMTRICNLKSIRNTFSCCFICSNTFENRLA